MCGGLVYSVNVARACTCQLGQPNQARQMVNLTAPWASAVTFHRACACVCVYASAVRAVRGWVRTFLGLEEPSSFFRFRLFASIDGHDGL